MAISQLSPSRASGGGVQGYMSARIWQYGSRRAVSEELYLGLQYAMMLTTYADRMFDISLDDDLKERYVWGTTALYGTLGIIAAGATVAGGIASGQFLYAGLAALAIPLQIDTMFKNLTQIERSARVRKYYERRENIIAAGLHG